MEAITYSLPTFNGPLDLLLHLISKNKVSIYDIPIIEITRQYIDYIEKMPELDLDAAGEFIVMASQLLYIKSKMLLPKAELDPAEDPRAELVEKLLEYSKYKELSRFLSEREDMGSLLFSKETDKLFDVSYENNFSISAEDLFSLFNEVIRIKEVEEIIPKKEFGEIAGHDKVSVRGQIKAVLRELKQKGGCEFHSLFRGLPTKEHIITRFLGVLELLKANRIDITKDWQVIYNGR